MWVASSSCYFRCTRLVMRIFGGLGGWLFTCLRHRGDQSIHYGWAQWCTQWVSVDGWKSMVHWRWGLFGCFFGRPKWKKIQILMAFSRMCAVIMCARKVPDWWQHMKRSFALRTSIIWWLGTWKIDWKKPCPQPLQVHRSNLRSRAFRTWIARCQLGSPWWVGTGHALTKGPLVGERFCPTMGGFKWAFSSSVGRPVAVDLWGRRGFSWHF